jgi:DNA polymerase III delta prime subunit
MAVNLSQLIKSPTIAPPKILVYGPPGIGKSTLAADAEAVLVDCENGAGAIPNLTRTPYLGTWKEQWEWLSELTKEPPPVMAIDTMDWMVKRIVEHVCIDLDGKNPGDILNTLGGAHGGFFKAREIVANVVNRHLFPLLNQFIGKGSAILMLAHAVNDKSTTPEGYDIKKAEPDIPEFIRADIIEWADCVFYASKSVEGTRQLQTEESNNVTAKNRYSMPNPIALSWQSVMEAITNSTKRKGQAQ